jgi:hypothetical protein
MGASLVDLMIKMEHRLGRLARAVLRMEAASRDLEHRLGRLARAVLRMEATSRDLEDVSGNVHRHCSS